LETLKFLFTSSFYPPYYIGGDAVHVSYLARELSARGHEVHVLHSLDAYAIKSRRMQQQTEDTAIRTHTIKTSLQLSAYASYLLGEDSRINRRFCSLVKEIKADVVHHHNISLLGYRILRRAGQYLNLYTAHDYWLFCQVNNLFKYGKYVCQKRDCLACSLVSGRPRQMWRYLPMFNEALHEIDAVIAPSRFMLQTLKLELPSLRIDHIPNFAPRANLNLLNGKSVDATYFVYVGVLEEPKGLLPLLDFYSKWARNREVTLKIVGTGSLAEQVARFIDKNKMQDCIVPLGWLPTSSVRRELLSATALIYPSLWPENAPLTALEALSVGTPVVASRSGGLPEIIEHLDPKLLFSWQRSDELKRALEFALDNNASLRKRATAVFENLFSPERYMKSYFDLIWKMSGQHAT
jgi:glycosyltransferase involved in cell wall biosynthesis